MKIVLLTAITLILLTSILQSQNYALQFSGSADIVNLNRDDISTSWTVEAWVYKTQNSSYSTLIDGQTGKITLESWGNNGKVGITAKGVADWAFNYSAPEGQWVHLAFVCDQTTTKLYVNGTLNDEMNHSISMPFNAFGQNNESPKMIIDEVRFWTFERTADEIAEYYNKSVDPASEGLAGYYYLDDQANEATDISVFHINGIIAGPVYVENDNPDFTTTLPEMTLNSIFADNFNEYFVKPGSTDQDILRIIVKTEGVTSPLHTTSVTVNLEGTDNLDNITYVKLYSTGLSSSFVNGELFGQATAPATEEITFTGNITLFPGSNYFWLTCDVSPTATTNNKLDAILTQIIANNETGTPDSTDYQGYRLILNDIPQIPAARNAVIPKPQEMTIDTSQWFELTSSTKIVVASTDSTLQEANFLSSFLQKATGFAFEVSTTTPAGGNISLSILDEYNDEIGEEGYLFNVDETGIKIEANTTAGLYYGTQTFRQLLPDAIESSEIVPGVTWKVAYTSITDYPLYTWRGLHFDVSRHFFGVDFIKKYLDAMAMNKLNRFHWHLTDDQGWRIEIQSKPLLQTISAWRTCNGTVYGGYYTQDEIADIVDYAAARHIMIIPEIEMPGHTVEVLAAYPGLSCATATQPYGGPFEVRCAWGTTYDIFCAGKEATFDFIEDVLTEVAEMFPGPYIHLGGDEANKTRWEQCPDCQARIQEQSLANEEELQRWFMERVGTFLETKNKKWIGWSEITYGGVPENATVMSWLGESSAVIAAQQGHDAILSPYSVLYLDAPNSNQPWEPPSIGYAPNTLEKIYFYNPMPDGLSPEEQEHIIGPHSCLWTEYISEEDHAEYMILPRIYALSEIGWSGNTDNFPDFRQRLYPKFQRLDILGYNYRPLDFPEDLLPEQLSTCDDQVVLTMDIPANSFYWNDENHSTTNSVTVTQSGTYKCYIDYLGELKCVSTTVDFKEEITQPSVDTTGQIWNATGNAEIYLWYNEIDHLTYIGNPFVPPSGYDPDFCTVAGAALVNKPGALYITGDNDYVELENSDFIDNAEAFTIEGWVKIHQYSTWDQLFTKRLSNTNRVSVELVNGRFYFEIGNGSNTYGYTAPNAIQENQWCHVAFVYDGTSTGNAQRMKVFIDGQEQPLSFSGSIPSHTPSNSASFTIGSPDADPGFEFTELRLWSRALSQEEIDVLKNVLLEQGVDEGLEYYFRTAQGSGNTLVNYSLNNNYTATIINPGSSTWQTGYTDVMIYECKSLKWVVSELITKDKEVYSNLDFSIVPNPNNGDFLFSLNLPVRENVTVSVYDMTGHKVFHKDYPKTKKINENIRLKNLPQGTYVFSINSGKHSGKKVFVVK